MLSFIYNIDEIRQEKQFLQGVHRKRVTDITGLGDEVRNYIIQQVIAESTSGDYLKHAAFYSNNMEIKSIVPTINSNNIVADDEFLNYDSKFDHKHIEERNPIVYGYNTVNSNNVRGGYNGNFRNLHFFLITHLKLVWPDQN
ncbi:hypothetical protein ACTA71_010996 [Dictyostelium dimigraforme]